MFIPRQILKQGDKVRLTRNVEVVSGTYTAGHEFTVESIGYRGPNLNDRDGNMLIETGFITPFLEVWKGEWVPVMRGY